jgi:hypothetical protein
MGVPEPPSESIPDAGQALNLVAVTASAVHRTVAQTAYNGSLPGGVAQSRVTEGS